MSRILAKDGDWADLDGRPCKVTRFTPLAKVESGRVVSADMSTPYAFVGLEALELPPDTMGTITHKVDFKHLWVAFIERGVCEDEEVVIFWCKSSLHWFAKLFSPFMPGLGVMVCKAGAYELMTDPYSLPELTGMARHRAELPIVSWTPDVFR